MKRHIQASVLFALLIGVILWYGIRERDQLMNAPCESFAGSRMERLPARCLKFYIDR